MRVLHGALLTGVWLLALGSVSPGDVLLGALLSAAVLRACAPPRAGALPPRQALVRAGALVRLAAVALGQALVGSLQVARLVLGLSPRGADGVVEVPLGERTEQGAAVTGLLATLSPGTVLLGVDAERRVLRFHVLDARAPEAVQEELQRLYARHQRDVFP